MAKRRNDGIDEDIEGDSDDTILDFDDLGDLDDLEIDESVARKGLETGFKNSVKKGFAKGTEEVVMPQAQKIASRMMSEVMHGTKRSPLDDVIDQEKKITELDMMRSLQDKLAGRSGWRKQEPSDGDTMAQIIQLKREGFSAEEITKYIRLMRGGSDPLMILELLKEKPRGDGRSASSHYAPPQQDNTMTALLPMIMQMSQQRQEPANNGTNELMGVFMTIMSQQQQQTNALMAQMNQQSREASERMMTFMATTQQSQTELMVQKFTPYMQQRDPNDEMIQTVEKFKLLKEVMGGNQLPRDYSQPIQPELLQHEQMMTQINHQAAMDLKKAERDMEKDVQQDRMLEKVTEMVEKGLSGMKARQSTEETTGKAEAFAERMARLRANVGAPPQQQQNIEIETPITQDILW